LIKIGIDESNYSPSLVGPCVVAVYRQRGQLLRGVKDSKVLNAKQRMALYRKLAERGDYVVTLAMPSDIARLGIYKARNIAAMEAIIPRVMSLYRYMLIRRYGMAYVSGHQGKATGLLLVKVATAGYGPQVYSQRLMPMRCSLAGVSYYQSGDPTSGEGQFANATKCS